MAGETCSSQLPEIAAMALDPQNESNLVQRPREDKRTLEKMRSKLATSGKTGGKRSAKPELRRTQPKKSIRIWPWIIGAAVILAGLNFTLHTQQDRIMSAMGVKQTAGPLTVPPGLKPDDQARFWAYAAYDVAKLRATFTIPKGAILDQALARRNLERLLAEDLGTSVRNEIFALQQAAAPAAAAQPQAKTPPAKP
jgi:hypothetical protein